MRLLKWAEIRAVLDEAEIRLSTRGVTRVVKLSPVAASVEIHNSPKNLGGTIADGLRLYADQLRDLADMAEKARNEIELMGAEK